MILALFPSLTLAVDLIIDRTSDIPDFNYDSEFFSNDTNSSSRVNLIPVVFSLHSATGWFVGKDSFTKPWVVSPYSDASPFNEYVLAAIMDSFWDDYDCSWSKYIYPVLWKNTQETEYNIHTLSPAILLQAEQTVNAGNWLFLDASRAVTELDELSYQWRQISGKRLLISNANRATAWVQTPRNIVRDETLKFQLQVTDSQGQSDIVIHTVFVTATAGSDNKPPVAYVGVDKSVSAGQKILLGGKKATDVDGFIVRYQWTQIFGPKVVMNNSEQEYIYVVMPDVEVTLKFKLTVTDDKGMTASVVQTVMVNN